MPDASTFPTQPYANNLLTNFNVLETMSRNNNNNLLLMEGRAALNLLTGSSTTVDVPLDATSNGD